MITILINDNNYNKLMITILMITIQINDNNTN